MSDKEKKQGKLTTSGELGECMTLWAFNSSIGGKWAHEKPQFSLKTYLQIWGQKSHLGTPKGSSAGS